jgi:hypothetical protein
VRWADALAISLAVYLQQWWIIGWLFQRIEQWLVQWRGFLFWFVIGFVWWVKLG